MRVARGARENTLQRSSFRDHVLETVAETLWPTRCAVCDALGDVLCPDCRDRLSFIDNVRACPVCGAPHGVVQCTECNPVMLDASEHAAFPFTAMASVTVLDDASHRLIVSYKDGGETRLATTIGRLMAAYVPPAWVNTRPVVTYIPSTHAARARRGFDHGALTSAVVAESLGLPHALLLSAPRNRDQRALSRRDRANNMDQRLRMLSGVRVPLSCLVVDDVCTTGATLYSAADALRAAGVEKLYALTFARA